MNIKLTILPNKIEDCLVFGPTLRGTGFSGVRSSQNVARGVHQVLEDPPCLIGFDVSENYPHNYACSPEYHGSLDMLAQS
jgi:hypothetical protein